MSARARLLVDIAADFVCPWCYIGLRSFMASKRDLFADYDVITRFRAYQLNADTPQEGVDREAYYEKRFPDPAFRSEARKRLAASAAEAGFDFDPSIPKRLPNTLKAHRVLRAAHFNGVHEAVALALYQGYWQDGADLGDDETLVRLAAGAGMTQDAVRETLASDESREATLAEAAGMARAGVQGVPTFIVNERTGFSGALPPARLAAALRKAGGA